MLCTCCSSRAASRSSIAEILRPSAAVATTGASLALGSSLSVLRMPELVVARVLQPTTFSC